MKFLLLYFSLVITKAFSVNILYLHGIVSPSHHFWNRRLAIGLAAKGYNVTFLSVDEQKGEKIENLHYIFLEDVYETLYGKHSFDIFEMARENKEEKFKSATVSSGFAVLECRAVMQSKKGFAEILNYPKNFKFDLIVNDFSSGPCLIPLAHKFNYPPIVGVSPFLHPPFTDRIVGGHKYPAYVPHFIIDFPQVMNFYQRFYNHLLYWIENL